jgi:hypothetical protein
MSIFITHPPRKCALQDLVLIRVTLHLGDIVELHPRLAPDPPIYQRKHQDLIKFCSSYLILLSLLCYCESKPWRK